MWTVKGCETGPTVYSPYPRRLESLTICGCNYKGNTFSSVILRPWVLVRPESNSRPPAWQSDAQPTEPPVRGGSVNVGAININRNQNWTQTPSLSWVEPGNFSWNMLKSFETVRRDQIINHKSTGVLLFTWISQYWLMGSSTFVSDLNLANWLNMSEDNVNRNTRFSSFDMKRIDTGLPA